MALQMNRVLPVILSGGIGARLWPVSRAAHPKPFMRLPDGESLLEKTLKRLAAIPHTGEVITVTNRELIFATREEYQAVPGEHRHLFLLEPQGRNTAAAVALAALCAKEHHPDDVLFLIMPADHLIGRLDRFASAIGLHNTVHRPWGTYTVLEQGNGYKIKRIVVKAGHALSLQMHRRRSEHWVVVSGVADVVNGDRRFQIRSNELTFIPTGHKHRLSNPGNDDLVIIEAQIGDYREEDDIVRFEDTYGRT